MSYSIGYKICRIWPRPLHKVGTVTTYRDSYISAYIAGRPFGILSRRTMVKISTLIRLGVVKSYSLHRWTARSKGFGGLALFAELGRAEDYKRSIKPDDQDIIGLAILRVEYVPCSDHLGMPIKLRDRLQLGTLNFAPEGTAFAERVRPIEIVETSILGK